MLQDNEDIYFRLQCRKFIEMIRRGAEIRASHVPPRRSNGHAANNGKNNSNEAGGGGGDWYEYDDMVNLDMEIDHPEQNGFDKMDKMDTSGTGAGGAVHDDYDRLLEETINFGKVLQAEFAHDQRKSTQRALQDAFALLAYEDPMESPHVAHQMFPEQRVVLADELNSAILGKDLSQPSLPPCALSTFWLYSPLQEHTR